MVDGTGAHSLFGGPSKDLVTGGPAADLLDGGPGMTSCPMARWP
jgi:hypothetical protein